MRLHPQKQKKTDQTSGLGHEITPSCNESFLHGNKNEGTRFSEQHNVDDAASLGGGPEESSDRSIDHRSREVLPVPELPATCIAGALIMMTTH